MIIIIQIKFDERQTIIDKIKQASNGNISDETINEILSNHTFRNITFIFKKYSFGTKVIIIDNDTGCDIALSDLNINASAFYNEKIKEISIAQ